MKILARKVVKLSGVFSEQLNKKTGTMIQKALNSQENRFIERGIDCFCDNSEGVTRLITYGKNTPIFKKGIHQVQITKLKNGAEQYRYFRDGKEIYSRGIGPDSAYENNPILNHNDLMDRTTFKRSLRDNVKALLNSIQALFN